jgi:predicted nuclease with TOPRIM domain
MLGYSQEGNMNEMDDLRDKMAEKEESNRLLGEALKKSMGQTEALRGEINDLWDDLGKFDCPCVRLIKILKDGRSE